MATSDPNLPEIEKALDRYVALVAEYGDALRARAQVLIECESLRHQLEEYFRQEDSSQNSEDERQAWPAGSPAPGPPHQVAGESLLHGAKDPQKAPDDKTVSMQAQVNAQPPSGGFGKLHVGQRFGNFQVLSAPQEGGMGQVYKVMDTDLKVVRALKLIGSGVGPSRRERFRREAWLAARVKDPYIVEIHGFGTQDGVDYLVMDWHDAGSLRDWLDDLKDRKIPIMRIAWFVEVLARTVGKIHEKWVTHRDLKPDNILVTLGAPGSIHNAETLREPIVIDFGLGAYEDSLSPSTEARSSVSDDAPATPNTRLTVTGQAFGTERYRAPEQWSVGVPKSTADIYSMGVILFEMLTTHTPFGDLRGAELLNAINEKPVPLPSSVRRDVPADIDAICRKCLLKDPNNRYQTALELAEELRRFRMNELVSARRDLCEPSSGIRPYRVHERAWKWWLRNWGKTSSSLAVAAVVLLISVLWIQARSNHQLAEKRFHDSFEMGETYFAAVSQSPRLRKFGLLPLRKELLSKARDYYQNFYEERPDDPNVRRERAIVMLRLAMITTEIDDPNDADVLATAEALAQKAAESLDAVHDPTGKVDSLARERALCHLVLGKIAEKRGETRVALREYQAANEILDQIEAQDPERNLKLLRTDVWHRIAIVCVALDDLAEAKKATANEVGIAEDQLQKMPKDPEAKYGVADAHNTAGNVWLTYARQSKDKDAFVRAKSHFTKGLDLANELEKQDPWDIDYLRLRCLLQMNLANLHFFQNNWTDAEPLYRAALVGFRKLKAGNIESNELMEREATALQNLCVIVRETDPAEGAKLVDEAMVLWNKLIRAQPSSARFPAELAVAEGNHGFILRRKKQYLEALRWYDQSLGRLKKLPLEFQRNAFVRDDLGKSHQGRAVCLIMLKRYQEAIADLDVVVDSVKGHDAIFVRLLRGYAQAHLGNHRAAVTDADATKHLPDGRTGDGLTSARIYSLSMKAAENDNALAEDREALVRRLAITAIDALKRDKKRGGADAKSLESDADLARLRLTPEYQAFRSTWAEK